MACRPSDTHRITGGSSGIQVGQLERIWYSNPREEKGRAERREASGSPHASFNSGISSVYSSDVRDKRLCMSLFSESAVSLCVSRLLPEPATQEDVVAWCTITVSEPWEPQASHSPEWPGASSSPLAEEQAPWPCSCCSLGTFLPLGADPSDKTICTLGSAGGTQ